MDFGLLPPEINSGRMYTGPGSGPMIAAAAAWDDLAAELHSTVASYGSVISGLSAEWRGASGAAMAAAAAPYLAWMSATAAQAEQTASQARMATAAYETAFAAMVAPPVIAANRALLMSLIATNLFGQNAAAIAATEVHYGEMWAQDAAAMYGYAGSSSMAWQLSPFRPPPQTTIRSATAGQAAATAHASGARPQTLASLMSGFSQNLQSLATSAAAPDPPSASTLLQLFSDAIGGFNPIRMYDPFGAFYDQGIQSFLAPFNNYSMQVAYADALSKAAYPTGGVGPGMPVVNPAGAAVSADLGSAGVVGSVSVPPGWASAALATRPIAAVLPASNLGAVPAALAADTQGSVFSNMALSGLAGRSVAPTGGTAGASANVVPAAAAAATIIVIVGD